MRHSTPRIVTRPGWALVACILALSPFAGLAVTARPAVAEEGIVTLRGDPAVEAAERDRLFEALAKAANAAEAQAIAAQVWALWFRAPDAEAAALMRQALDRRGGGDYSGAVALLDTLISGKPEWAEAWNQRATMRYLLRDFEGSLDDIAHVLALEPKHFGALSGQALILMHQGKMEAGQLALRRAVDIDPFLSERALIMGPAGKEI